MYHSVATNLYGEDRAEAMKHWDNDEEFDAWMQRYEAKQSAKLAESGGGKGRVSIGKEQYIKHFAKIHGGEESE